MKNAILIIIATLSFSLSGLSNDAYYKAMGESLSKYAQCSNSEQYLSLGLEFGRIAKVEHTEWLPKYYQVHCHVMASFMESDADKKDEYLDTVEETLDMMIAEQPQNSEVYVLQAMFYTARLVVDPASRGRKYSGLSGKATAMAKAMNPQNPRATYMEISNSMGSARFFGEDVSQYCEQAQEALNSFDSFVPESPISPQWGKQQLSELANSCK